MVGSVHVLLGTWSQKCARHEGGSFLPTPAATERHEFELLPQGHAGNGLSCALQKHISSLLHLNASEEAVRSSNSPPPVNAGC